MLTINDPLGLYLCQNVHDLGLAEKYHFLLLFLAIGSKLFLLLFSLN
jgi:hypothetical protein